MSEQFDIRLLLSPERLFRRADVISRKPIAPTRPGIYAWYFDQIPALLGETGLHEFNGLKLLYVGISPKAPSPNGSASRQTLRSRLRGHLGGNAAGSTLRLTLGCLLADEIGIELRRVGSGGRYTFTNPGERLLDKWLENHAFVTWIESSEPWLVERQILASDIPLPLNLDANQRIDLAAKISAVRSAARRRADALPILSDSGGPRRL